MQGTLFIQAMGNEKKYPRFAENSTPDPQRYSSRLMPEKVRIEKEREGKRRAEELGVFQLFH